MKEGAVAAGSQVHGEADRGRAVAGPNQREYQGKQGHGKQRSLLTHFAV